MLLHITADENLLKFRLKQKGSKNFTIIKLINIINVKAVLQK